PLAVQLGGEQAGWVGMSPMYAEKQLPNGDLLVATPGKGGIPVTRHIARGGTPTGAPQLPPPPAGKDQWYAGDEVRPGFILNTDGKLMAMPKTSGSSRADSQAAGDDPVRDVPFADMSNKEFLDALGKIPDTYMVGEHEYTRTLSDKLWMLQEVDKYRRGEVGELGLPPSAEAIDKSKLWLQDFAASWGGLRPEQALQM